MQAYEESFLHKSQKHNKKKKAISLSNVQTHIEVISNSAPQTAPCVLHPVGTEAVSLNPIEIRFRFAPQIYKTVGKSLVPKANLWHFRLNFQWYFQCPEENVHIIMKTYDC